MYPGGCPECRGLWCSAVACSLWPRRLPAGRRPRRPRSPSISSPRRRPSAAESRTASGRGPWVEVPADGEATYLFGCPQRIGFIVAGTDARASSKAIRVWFDDGTGGRIGPLVKPGAAPVLLFHAANDNGRPGWFQPIIGCVSLIPKNKRSTTSADAGVPPGPLGDLKAESLVPRAVADLAVQRKRLACPPNERAVSSWGAFGLFTSNPPDTSFNDAISIRPCFRDAAYSGSSTSTGCSRSSRPGSLSRSARSANRKADGPAVLSNPHAASRRHGTGRPGAHSPGGLRGSRSSELHALRRRRPASRRPGTTPPWCRTPTLPSSGGNLRVQIGKTGSGLLDPAQAKGGVPPHTYVFLIFAKDTAAALATERKSGADRRAGSEDTRADGHTRGRPQGRGRGEERLLLLDDRRRDAERSREVHLLPSLAEAAGANGWRGAALAVRRRCRWRRRRAAPSGMPSLSRTNRRRSTARDPAPRDRGGASCLRPAGAPS